MKPRPKRSGWSSQLPQARTWWSGLVIGLGASLVFGLIATATVFSIARGTTKVADIGQSGVYQEASLSAAATSRNRTVQAYLISEAHELGLTTSVQLAESLESAEAARTEFLARIDRVSSSENDETSSSRLRAAGQEFAEYVDEAVALIRAGDLARAEAVITDDLETAYESVAEDLADGRDEAIAHLSLAGEDAGRLADATRFVVALFFPVGVVLAYRTRVRSQTRRRNLEQQLERQMAVAKTKDEVIANLSHELRTPLTGIYGFALELLEHDDPMLVNELARLIVGESAELTRMVEDLLTAATAERGGLLVSMSDVDPEVEIAAVLEPLAATGVRVDSEIRAAQVRADRLRLRQVVRNLVANAHRHGGARIVVLGYEVGDRYAIDVCDNGDGVPTAIRDKLFERYVHEGTDPLTTGSVGLGLAICRLLVELMGGTITYGREDGATIFTVTLPLAAAPATLSSSAAHSLAQ